MEFPSDVNRVKTPICKHSVHAVIQYDRSCRVCRLFIYRIFRCIKTRENSTNSRYLDSAFWTFNIRFVL